MAHLNERDVFAKTLYAEARGEPEEGQRWVAWVIKNRARLNKPYWGGGSIKGVCLSPGQFECWNGRSDIPTNAEPGAYQSIRQLTDAIYDGHGYDPTDGADHYHNPSEGHQPWMDRVDFLRRIGHHDFFRTQPQFL